MTTVTFSGLGPYERPAEFVRTDSTPPVLPPSTPESRAKALAELEEFKKLWK